jgi:very-short-patch-repair endonuclease
MKDEQSPHKLSTSALAKLLELPSQLLFTTLKDYAWIRKLDEGWELTAKGEFEGGEYVQSKKFGRYIVWPEELAEHPLLIALEDSRHVSATVLGKPYGLNARQVNRLLAELGWIKHTMQGWELTGLGEHCSGVQLENESSATFYTVWPESVRKDVTLIRQLQQGSEANIRQPVAGDDFFKQPGTYEGTPDGTYDGIDGHRHKSTTLMRVCHWLYMAGIAHACQRQLPVDQLLFADFYLPAHQLYIECWGEEEGSSELAGKMKRKDLYKKLGLSVLNIEKSDLDNLDEIMTRRFRKAGIRIY